MIEFDFIDWDDADDPQGNIAHIADGGVTVEEVEDVLYSSSAVDDSSRSSGLPVRFGWTSSGKYLIVVYQITELEGFVIVTPVTAYEVPPPD